MSDNDIDNVLTGIRDLIENVGSMVNTLEEAIEPILVPSVPKGEAKEQSDPISGSPLSQQLQELAQAVEKIRRKVGNLTERVDFKRISTSKDASE